MKEEDLLCLFRTLASSLPGKKAGIVGYGTFGKKVAECAVKEGFEVLINDPPLEMEESSEVFEAFQEQWGNGMGRCYYSDTLTATFLPLTHLVKECDVLSIQIPENEENKKIFTAELFSAFKPDGVILSFSSGSLFPFSDKRILFPEE